MLCMIPSKWVHVILYLYESMECTTPRLNPKKKYGLWVIKMCQCRFLHCNKGITLVGAVDNGKAMVHV